MDCKDFEQLLTDAIGNELTGKDRSKFEEHISGCETCRGEFESLKRAVDEMRALPGPALMTLGLADERPAGLRSTSRAPEGSRLLVGGKFRYAAGVMIAFLAGYALHAGLMIGVAPSPGTALVQTAPDNADDRSGTSLQLALLSAHQRSPQSSDLAKCLVAMFPSGG